MENKKNLTGQTFGHLTVLREAPHYVTPAGKAKRQWVCRCECGKETTVVQNSLIQGQTKSCGCLRGKQRQLDDLTGCRFGLLTVLSEAEPDIKPSGRDERCWLCRCDCGNEKVVKTSLLKYGDTQSCGCAKESALRKHILEDNVLGRYKGTAIASMKQKVSKNNTSGAKGVSKLKGKWMAYIMLKRKRIYLGLFDTIEEAAEARKEAEEKYYTPIIEEFNSLNC